MLRRQTDKIRQTMTKPFGSATEITLNLYVSSFILGNKGNIGSFIAGKFFSKNQKVDE